MQPDSLAPDWPAPRPTSRAADPKRPQEGGALLGLLLRATQDGIVDWDLIHNEESYNPRWAHLFGFDDYASDSPIDWRELVHPDEAEATRRLVADHLVEDWPLVTTVRMRHRCGGYRTILLRGAAQRDARGQPVRMVIIFSDISDRIALEARHVALAAALPDTVFRVAGGRIVDHKPGNDHPDSPFRKLAEGLELTRCLPPAVVGRLRAAFASNGANVPLSPGLELVTPNGPALALHHEVRVVASGNDEWVCIVRDVTERHALADRLLQSEKLGAIGQLAAGVAHEINTPMQYIGDNLHFARTAIEDLLSYNQQLKAALEAAAQGLDLSIRTALADVECKLDMAYVTAELPRAIERSLEGMGRVTTIVRALKTFAHPGQRELGEVDLGGLIESAVAVATNEWKYVASIQVAVDPELPPVRCAGGELSQVLLNLLVNAAHAITDRVGNTGEKGRITIEAERVGERAELRVRDTGTGIPEHARSRIFEPFFTTKEVGKGTGQGLALVHTFVVNHHGGTVHFETELGVGTTFVVSIPIAGPAAKEAASGTDGAESVASDA